MEKHASRGKIKSMLCEFSSQSPSKKIKIKIKKAHLESGQSILVLFYHSDGRGEPFLVINRGAWLFFFQVTTTNKR